jgi:hypothetical protein
LYVSAVEGVDGEGYATLATTGPDYGAGGIAVASAAIRVEGNLLQFIGIAPTLDEAEFVRLVNAAAERVWDVL